MAAPGAYSSYKTNVGRSVTKKWKEANQISYDGDDWGDDDDEEYGEHAPMPADNSRHPPWGPPPNVYPSNRSVTNPSPSRAGGRPSFDRGDDRRTFSSSAGFDSAYPTSQRSPFPEPQHEYEPPPNFREPPPLRVNTYGQGSTPPGFRPGSRGRQYPPYNDPSYGVPGAFPQSRRSGSSNRPVPSDIFQRHESPMRPDSRGSNASGRQFPPRKASLSQKAPPADFLRGDEPITASPLQQGGDSHDDRPIPVFVRPSDIYKRLPEEMEKARQSQESSRPSIDPGTGRVRGTSVGSRSTSSDAKDITTAAPPLPEESDSVRRLKPTLDPVPERKSEYGFDNMLQKADSPPQPEDTIEVDAAAGVSRQSTTASSVYTDRPDPVSASSISRNVSLNDGALEAGAAHEDRPSFGLPPIARTSVFGFDLSGFEHKTMSETPRSAGESSTLAPSNQRYATDDHSLGSPAPGLQHQPSLGYRSVVQQAFEESEKQTPFSPVSTSGTVARSNSNSTSEISPIIPHHQEQGAHVPMAPTAYPTIPEEASQSESRPISTTTLSTIRPTSVRSNDAEGFSPPAPMRASYRREVTPPSRDNSPAKRPISVEQPIPIEPQHVSMADENDQSPARVTETPVQLPIDKPLPADPEIGARTSQSEVEAPDRTTSEEWKDWQAQKKNFNAQAGFDESASSTPYAPSPVQRSGTPAKGTVRDLAEKLETRSGSSTPIEGNMEQSRPAPQSRLESFRPSIPGGWHSYASTPGSSTPAPPQQSADPPTQSQPPMAPARSDSTESIPTARAPANPAPESDGVTQQAFAAAATAGSALANALAGKRLTGQTHDSKGASEVSSENEWDASSSDSEAEVEPPLPHEPENRNRENEDAEEAQVAHSASLDMAPRDSPSQSTTNLTSGGALGETITPARPVDYMPPPLRTSRLHDTSNPSQEVPDVLLPRESPADGDYERLQLEIEKSLTPTSTTFARGLEQNNQPQEDARPTEDRHLREAEADFIPPQEPNETQTATQTAENDGPGTASPIPHQTGVKQSAPNGERPFLQQRFSWETGSEQTSAPVTPHGMSPPSTGSPDTIRAPAQAGSSPREVPVQEPNVGLGFNQQVTLPEVVTSHSEGRRITSNNAPAAFPSKQAQVETASFRAIMNLSTPQERIRAFNETRDIHATPDGQLENWLLSLNNSEHSDLFATNGRGSHDANDDSPSHKPAPRRILTDSAGARQMQEDGKRLMAKAGRFGGKAGTAAKGLFAKGKGKMRNASTGEKGPLTTRRKSTAEAEDSFSPPQSRDSASPDVPPQIPFTISPASPYDWFSRPILEREASHLSQTVQPEDAASSSIENDESLDEQRKGHVREIPTSDAVSMTRAAPSSPTISALDSEQHGGADTPSRSISQLTKPTAEHSPVEPAQQITVEQVAEGQTAPWYASHGAQAPEQLTEEAFTPPRTLLGHPDGSRSDVQSSDQSLIVPQDRRRSVISDVSSASPGPGPDLTGVPSRGSISPADETPGMHEQFPHKATEAPSTVVAPLAADTHAHSGVLDRTEAQYPDPDNQDLPQELMKPKVETAERLPMESPPPQEEQEHDEAPPRRSFSFTGLQGVGEIHQAEQKSPDLRQVPTQPFSPVSQTLSNPLLSKEMSEVSVEEVSDQAHVPAQRQSRSYSRPFGVDPNVRNHPAFRTPETEHAPVDKSQMYSSESPLPSVRRAAQEELDRSHQRSEQGPTNASYRQPGLGEEKYRIPGPYIQEYRSPKQISAPRIGRSPIQVEASGQTLPSARRSQQYSNPGVSQSTNAGQPNRFSYASGEQQHYPDYHGQVDDLPDMGTGYQDDIKSESRTQLGHEEYVQPQRQSMGPPPVPAPQPSPLQAGRRKSAFGGLFGGSSKSRSKLQKADRSMTPADDRNGERKEKRASIFRRNSRHDSISSERSSQYGGHDTLSQFPSASLTTHSGRRLSRDLLWGATPEPKDQPTETKKKRFSGLGGRLFKSSSSRASNVPTLSTQHQGMNSQQGPSHAVIAPQPYSAQSPYDRFSDVPGGFFQQETGHYPQTMYPQGPLQQHPVQDPAASTPYHHQATAYPDSQTPRGMRQPLSPYSSTASPYMNPEQRRPSDLRIDTSGGGRTPHGIPATAPAQIYPPRDGAFVDSLAAGSETTNRGRDIVKTSSPANVSSPATTGQQSSTQPNPHAHVVNLHKRARSPRMGRQLSSEDLDVRRQQPGPSSVGGGGGEYVSKLGTFSSKKISPVGGIPRNEGDQERPYAIVLPGLDEEDERKRKLAGRTTAETGSHAGPGRSDTPVSVESENHGTTDATPGALQAGTGAGHRGLDRNVSVLDPNRRSPSPTGKSNARHVSSGFVAELPGSRAEGYESEEEIPMSATAYPGQEWVPVFVGDGRWDD